MKRLLSYFFLLISTNAFAQKTNESFNFIVQTVNGDLNKDGLEDEVIVSQDTLAETKPFRLQIYFMQKNGSKKLIVSTTKAIQPDDMSNGINFDKGIQIIDGTVYIYEQLLRGNYTHTFRYQHANFELIGYTEIGSYSYDKSYETEFNLSTGIKIEKEENTENGKILSIKKTKVRIRPLPKLQNFEPYTDERF